MPKKNIIRNEVHQVIEVVKEDKKVMERMSDEELQELHKLHYDGLYKKEDEKKED